VNTGRALNLRFGISKKFRNVGGCLKGVAPLKGDSGATRLPGQGASALLRVPHGQAGLRSAIGPVRPSGEVCDRRELSSDCCD